MRRWRALAILGQGSGTAAGAPGGRDTHPYLTSFRILHGSAFSIDPETINGEFDIDPVILAASARLQPSQEPGEVVGTPAAWPLLTPVQHRHFVKKRFRQAERCPPRYTLEDGLYLVLDSEVQAALDVVRQVQHGTSCVTPAPTCATL
jgi:hypothetical protein